MENDLKIITLESIDGIGISTQVRFLEKHLTDFGFTVKTFKFSNIENAIEQINSMNEFLIENSKGIVINDGSFAKSIANDMFNSCPRETIEEKYKHILYSYQCLNHKYKILNLILLPENSEMGQKRLARHAKVLGREYSIVKNFERQKCLLRLLGELNNHVITRSIDFNTLEIDEDDKILDINGKILKLLENFDIKKPS